jgi:hypothetical protein
LDIRLNRAIFSIRFRIIRMILGVVSFWLI